jgi:hypothetical protein
MADKKIYIVDFSDEVADLEKKLYQAELPTIDLDMTKWCIMEIFSQVDPLKSLTRLVDEMVDHDWLFSRTDYFSDSVEDAEDHFPITPERARELDLQMRGYVKQALVYFGQKLFQKMRELGFFLTNRERYVVTSRPLNHDHTYLLKRTRG